MNTGISSSQHGLEAMNQNLEKHTVTQALRTLDLIEVLTALERAELLNDAGKKAKSLLVLLMGTPSTDGFAQKVDTSTTSISHHHLGESVSEEDCWKRSLERHTQLTNQYLGHQRGIQSGGTPGLSAEEARNIHLYGKNY